MKKSKSISFTAGFFFYFLIASYYNHAKDIYTPLVQSIKDGNVFMGVMFGLEMLSILTIATCIVLLIRNISKGVFFAKSNFIYFYTMGYAFMLPVLDYAVIGRFICKIDIQIDFALYIAAGTFMFLLAEIFRHGYRMKEEQDLIV